ncbi:hypothetical protein [Planotetraspora sp. GP83]|uniref:hypothetical protein n=1 Tax=Planotetraspora sp. GP83 TaxID=3156264 RepID=UPI003518F580
MTVIPADIGHASEPPHQGDGGGRPGPKLFTLDQARQELAQRECAEFGHDVTVMLDGWGQPSRLVCDRPCGHPGWVVLDASAPDLHLELLRAAMLDLWADLAVAYLASETRPRESSVACHGLMTRIQDVARHIGPVEPEKVPPLVVTTGLYELVHAAAGCEVQVPPQVMEAAWSALEQSTGGKAARA